ncbi:MAG: YfcE family phosphodiesterase [Bacteroidota bacterium]|jgi:putative phosphoesterase
MEIAILSDIHDNLKNLDWTLSFLTSRNISHAIFCGDFCSPFVINSLGKSGIEVHAVLGNNDGDRFNIQKNAQNFPNIHLYGEYFGDENNIVVLDSVRFGCTHYHFYAKTMVKTGWYDVVCFGHSHQQHKQKFGNALLINPGEIAGNFSSPSFAIYDTDLRSSNFIAIPQ